MYVGLALTVISVAAHYWEIIVIRQAGHPSSFQVTSFCLSLLDSSARIPENRKGGKEMGDGATENGIRLLATQKPTKRPGWWERKLALFWIPATGVGGGYGGGDVCLSRGQLLATYIQQVGKSFYRLREGATCRNSTVSSDSHLEIGHTVDRPASSWLF